MAPIITNVDAILDSVPKAGFSHTTIVVGSSLFAVLILALIVACMIKCAEYEDENEWEDGKYHGYSLPACRVQIRTLFGFDPFSLIFPVRYHG